jgi:mRNA interferase HigB
MNIITQKKLAEYASSHADTAQALFRFTQSLRIAAWKDFNEVRDTFPHADMVKVSSGHNVVVFNVGGNKCRVITAIHFNRQTIYILDVLTHAEYNRNDWQKRL